GSPDYVKIAEAFGIRGLRLRTKEECDTVLREAQEYSGPVLVDCIVESEENVYPMIPSGGTIQEMLLDPALRD
ncbi:MAG: acetolactate synthase catalytic subunit, partial [Chloroflexota bacterium]